MDCGISFAGVGGQGVLLMVNLLSQGLMLTGLDIKVSESHGMAQRGGSVVSQLRFGNKVFSPVLAEGQSDILVALERLEALRYLRLLKPGGTLLCGDSRIPPLSVLTGKSPYPDGIMELLEQQSCNLIPIDANRIAGDLGNTRAQNIVMLGALIKVLNLTALDWHSILKQVVPAPLYDINRRALEAGMRAV